MTDLQTVDRPPELGLPQTEFSFRLPVGYLDDSGQLHRDGTIRLARARDEIVLLRDVRVRDNEAYLTVLLLARTVTRLGTLKSVDPPIIEGLFAVDLAYLQDMYRRINAQGHTNVAVTCPSCSEDFEVDVAGDVWGIVTYAPEELLFQVAYVAAAYHWSYDSILDLEHRDRLSFIEHARTLGGDGQ